MSEQPTTGATRREIATFGGQPAYLWVGALASAAMIIGGPAPWATAFGFISFSGTRMHGWNEIALGILGLGMLGLHGLRGVRVTLIVAAVGGVLGAMQAVVTMAKLDSNGAVTVLGVQYRYLDPAWGLYLVLAGGIALACAAALAWRAGR
jgi:hypothetical protein